MSDHTETFLKSIKESYEDHEGLPAWLLDEAKAGESSFLAKGLPTTKSESWRYTNLRKFRDMGFKTTECTQTEAAASAVEKLSGRDDISIVYVDGIFSQDLSTIGRVPPGVLVSRLSDMTDSEKERYDETSTACSGIISDPFIDLNKAFSLNDALYIGVESFDEVSFNFVYFSTEGGSMHASFPRVTLWLGAGAKALVKEAFIGEGSEYFVNPLMDIRLSHGASLHHYRSQLDQSDAFHVGHTRISQAKDSHYETYYLGLGAKIGRHALGISLSESGASAVLDGVYLGKGDQVLDQNSIVLHAAPHTKSSQYYKGLLGGKSRGVFNGRVHVQEGAVGTRAAQLNKNLLLNDDVEADTRPQLEIDVDDVKCSHGATVGQLNENEVFYFQTRGVPAKDAKRMLCHAYAEEIILKVPHAEVREFMSKRLEGAFDQVEELRN